MAHICTYIATLKYEITTDRFYYETTAYWYKKGVLMNSMVVQKVYEDGEMFERHLRLTSGGGWLVYFVGEKRTESYYYSSIVEEEEPWYRVQAKANDWARWEYNLSMFDRKPELKYLMEKISKCLPPTTVTSLDLIFALIRAWKEHPQQTEYLLSQNKVDLALSKRLYLLSANKQREVLKVVKADKGKYDITISTILQMLKHKIYNYDEWCDYQAKKRDELYKYLICQHESETYYQDYLKLCKQCKKNLNDKYWRFPKDLREKHNELLKEVKAEKNKSNNEKLHDFVIDKLGGQHALKIDGYEIYIPSSVEDIEEQANALNQCLITCDYHKKMASGNTILVFMRKGDKPIATCEINKGKQIKQFYANEAHRDHCKPTEKMKKAMNKYLTELKLKGAKKK